MLYSRKVGALPGLIAAENVLRSRRDYGLASKAQQDAADYRRDYLSSLNEAKKAALADRDFERKFRQDNYNENRKIQMEQSRLDKERYDEDRELRRSKYEQEGRIAEENLALAQMEKQRRQQNFDMANLARQRYGNLYPDLEDNELISIGTYLSQNRDDNFLSNLDKTTANFINQKRSYKKTYDPKDSQAHEVAMAIVKNMKFNSAEEQAAAYRKYKNDFLNETSQEVLTGKDAESQNLINAMQNMEKK